MNEDQQHRQESHVVVSGGSRGVGRTLVEALLSRGHRVSTFSRSETAFVRDLKGEARFFHAQTDIADAGEVARFVAAAEARHGPPFGLVNCAGIAIDGVAAAMRPDQIDKLLTINLAGPLNLTRELVRRMLVNRIGGSIIMISSIIGLRGYSGLSSYAASKGGMDAAMRALARELGPRGIRVNSVAPGYLETEMTGKLDAAQRGQIIRRTPLGRLGTPEDVVGPTLFLLSEESRFMTGQILVVDGGIST